MKPGIHYQANFVIAHVLGGTSGALWLLGTNRRATGETGVAQLRLLALLWIFVPGVIVWFRLPAEYALAAGYAPGLLLWWDAVRKIAIHRAHHRPLPATNATRVGWIFAACTVLAVVGGIWLAGAG